MARRRATRGNQAQFTYDFGIAIAQSTVNKVARLTGVTLTLASAFYALKTTASDYLNTLRSNTLRFGGVLSTIRSIEQAQNRLIKGQSYFNVDDQLAGMNQLMTMGVNVRENFEWINKSAHATGKSFAEFSNAIAAGIGGNMQQLVDMGLLTQRATRMFDKYQANTIMRQQAILNFVKNHKGLMNAIKNDFETVQDQMTRIRGIWQAFLQSILGKPNDPNSFYGQITASMKMVAVALARNMEQIKRYGYIIGQTLGWVIRQIGHFVVWIGRQAKRALESVWTVTDNFQEQSRSLLVWLEFWKLKVVDFFKQYGGEIKSLLKMMLLFKALKTVFVISKAAIASAAAYNAALFGRFGLFTRIGRIQRGVGTSWWKAFWLAVLPRWVIRALTSVSRFLSLRLPAILSNALNLIRAIGGYLGGSLIGRIATVGAKFTGVVGVVWGIWEALDAVGKWFKPLGNFMDERKRQLREFTTGIKNSWFLTIDSIRHGWQDFTSWFSTNVVGVIRKKWQADGMPEYFANIKNKAKEAITYIGDILKKYIIDPIKQAFGWLGDIIKKGLQNRRNVLSREQQERDRQERNIAYARARMLVDANKEARRRGEKPRYSMKDFPEIVQRDLAANALAERQRNTQIATPTSDVSFNPNAAPWTPSVNDIANAKNPIIEESSKAAAQAPTDLGGGSPEISMMPGAVQIIVQKGEHIDENKLARKVREIIEDMERSARKRGGM